MGFWNWLFGKNKQASIKRKSAIIWGCVFPAALLATSGATIGILISLGAFKSSPYFTTHIASDTLKDDGTGSASIKVDLYNGADFNKLSFDSNGTNFTLSSTDVNQHIFMIDGTESIGDHQIKIIGYEDQYVGVHVESSATPTPTLSATVNGSLKINSSQNATITVTGTNGANTSSLSASGYDTNKLTIGAFNSSGVATVSLGSSPAANNYPITIGNGAQSTTCQVTVEKQDATKNIVVTLSPGSLIFGSALAQITVIKGENGTNLSSLNNTTPSLAGFTFTNWVYTSTDNTARCTVAWYDYRAVIGTTTWTISADGVTVSVLILVRYSNSSLIQPNMTSNTSGNFAASCSTTQSESTYPAYKAFDGITFAARNYWDNNANIFPANLTLNVDPSSVGKKCVPFAYTITAGYADGYANWQKLNPTAWNLRGSNDNSSWTNIDTQSNWTYDRWKQQDGNVCPSLTFNISTIRAFKYLQLNITQGNDVYVGICELQFFGYITA